MYQSILLSLVLAPLLLSGCTTPKYACGVPDGIGCKPLSEVHRLAQSGALKMRSAPDNRETDAVKKPAAPRSDVERLARLGKAAIVSAPAPEGVDALPPVPALVADAPLAPTLIPPRTLRVWVARWADDGGTLHDESYLHLMLDHGRWQVE